MAESTEDSGTKQINVVVKTPKDKETIQIDEKAGIKEVNMVYSCLKLVMIVLESVKYGDKVRV